MGLDDGCGVVDFAEDGGDGDTSTDDFACDVAALPGESLNWDNAVGATTATERCCWCW